MLRRLFAALYDTNFPQWKFESEVLCRADQLPDRDVSLFSTNRRTISLVGAS